MGITIYSWMVYTNIFLDTVHEIYWDNPPIYGDNPPKLFTVSRNIFSWLVVSIPLKNMKISWDDDMIFPTDSQLNGEIKNVPNHQPVTIHHGVSPGIWATYGLRMIWWLVDLTRV